MQIHNSTGKLFLLTIFASLSFLASVKCLLSDNNIIQIVGVLNSLFALTCIVIFLKTSLDRKPFIVVDETGITDRRILKRKIRWEEIESFKILEKGRQSHLILEMKTSIHLSEFKYFYRNTSKKLLSTPQMVEINLSFSKYNAEEFQNNLNKYIA